MEPELRKQIKEWEKMLTPEQAKRLFIRDSAYKAYKTGNGSIQEVTTEALKEVINLATVGNMTKEQIGMHIANLEQARVLLSSLVQGYQIAFAEEKEPEFKKKHEQEERERKSKTSKPKSLEESLAKLGLNLSSLMASMDKETKAKTEENLEVLSDSNKPPAINTIPATSNKFKCEKCGKEMFIAMKSFHKC